MKDQLIFKIKAKKYTFSIFPPEGLPSIPIVNNHVARYYTVSGYNYAKVRYQKDNTVSIFIYTGNYWKWIKNV